MSIPQHKAHETFGGDIQAEKKAEASCHLAGPGNPIELDVIPLHIGQEYFDTADGHFWRACGLTQADWKRQTSDNP